MRRIFSKKIHNTRGFSLAEALAAVVILLLVTSIVAAGLPAAANALDKAVTGANAQVLLSTAVTALRDELGTARSIAIHDDQQTIEYYSADTRSRSELYLSAEGERKGEIMLREYLPYATYLEGVVDAAERRLVTSSAATNGLFITYDSAKLDPVSEFIELEGLPAVRRGDAGDCCGEAGYPRSDRRGHMKAGIMR